MTGADERYESAKRLMNLKARIVSGPAGGPIRTLKNFNANIPSGRYTSVKCRRPMDWEAFHERHLYWICEADAKVVKYLSQPHRLEMFLKGQSKPLKYYPDVMRKLADGTVEIIETKKTLEEVSDDPKYETKLALAKQVYEEEKGWVFRVMTAKDDIEVEPLLSNARLVKRDAQTRVLTIDKLQLLEALHDAHGTLPYTKAVASLVRKGVDERMGRAKLHAMVVARLVQFDITRELLPETPVHALRDPESILPRKRRESRQ